MYRYRTTDPIVVHICPNVGYLIPYEPSIIASTTAQRAVQRSSAMVHDLILAVSFLGLILAPAIIAMRSDKGDVEEDSL
jgi:hypothetical protein